MNAFPLIASPPVLIEISEDALRIVDEDRDFESPVQRLPGGRLTEPCRQRLEEELRAFLRPRAWQPRRRAVCAIGARGVSLRRLMLPAHAQADQRTRLLRLQIESEFPLPPADLAWGALPLNDHPSHPAAGSNGEEMLVVATRRELVDQYRTLLANCGLNPVFTLAALARARLCPASVGTWTLIDVRRRDAELVVFDRRKPTAIQVLTWDSEHPADPTERFAGLEFPKEGTRVCLTGDAAGCNSAADALSRAFGDRITVEYLPASSDRGLSPALQGLQSLAREDRARPTLLLQTDAGTAASAASLDPTRTWAIAVGILALACVAVRYTETRLQRTRLDRAIAQVRTYRESLPLIDQQLGFLQYLQTNRHPYLRLIAAVGQAATPGIQIESISVDRRGDLLLRGTLQGQQPPTDFRTKLVESGAFTSVVLEEQTPSQNRQKVSFRIAARWDPNTVRALPELPAVEKKPTGFGPPGMPMPGGLPPGITLPPGVSLPAGISFPEGPMPRSAVRMPNVMPSPAPGGAPSLPPGVSLPVTTPGGPPPAVVIDGAPPQVQVEVPEN